MVDAVRTIVRDHGTMAYLRDLPHTADKIGNFEAWNLTQTGSRYMKESAHAAGIKSWTGHMFSGTGIHAVKRRKGSYAISFPYYANYLDNMPIHKVSLKRGRGITRWARSKGIMSKAITVYPHPYISNAYLKMLIKLNLTTTRIANKIVRGKK